MTETKPATKVAAGKVPAVYGALLAVTEGLKNVPKNGVMKFGNTSYNYLKADDVQEALNPLLIANKLIVQSSYTVEQVNRGRGEGAPFVNVNLYLTYVSAVDGSELTVSSVGESAGSDDKSVNKALTQAMKNSHRAQFQFASGEPEPDDLPTAKDTPAQAPATPAGPTVASLKGEIAKLLNTKDGNAIRQLGDALFEGKEGWADSVKALTQWRDELKAKATS